VKFVRQYHHISDWILWSL